MGRRFRAGQERRSHLHPERAQGERRGDTPAVGNAARRDHRNAQRIDDLRHQGEGADATGLERRLEGAAVAAGLEPLGDDGIDTGVFQVFRLGDGGGRAQDHRARRLDRLHRVRRRQPEMEADDGRRSGQNGIQKRLVEAGVGRRRRRHRAQIEFPVIGLQPGPHGLAAGVVKCGFLVDEEIDVVGAVGGGPDGGALAGELFRAQEGAAERSQAAGVGHGDGQFRRRRAGHRRLDDGDVNPQQLGQLVGLPGHG